MSIQTRKPRLPSMALMREAEQILLASANTEIPEYRLEERRREGARISRAIELLRQALAGGRVLSEEARTGLMQMVRENKTKDRLPSIAGVLRLDAGLGSSELEELLPYSYYNSEPAAEFMAHPALRAEQRSEILADFKYGSTMRQKLLVAQHPLPEGMMRQLWESFTKRGLRNWWPDVVKANQCPMDLRLEILDHPGFSDWEKISKVRTLRNIPEIRQRLLARLSPEVCMDLLADRRAEEYNILVRGASRLYRGELTQWLKKNGVLEGCSLSLEDIDNLFRIKSVENIQASLSLPGSILSDLSEDEKQRLRVGDTLGDLPRVRAAVAEGGEWQVWQMLMKDGRREDFEPLARRLLEKHGIEMLLDWLEEEGGVPEGCSLDPLLFSAALGSEDQRLRERGIRAIRLLPKPAVKQVSPRSR